MTAKRAPDELYRDANVLLYQDDVRKPWGWVPLERLLRRALADKVPSDAHVRMVVTRLPKRDPTPSGANSFINLEGGQGVFYIYIFDGTELLHSGEHPIRECLEPVLARLTPQGGQARWFFEITRPSDGEMLVMPSLPFPNEPDPRAEHRRALPISLRRIDDLPAARAERPEPRSLPTVVLRIRVGHQAAEVLDELGLSDVVRPAPRVEGTIEVNLSRPRSVPFSIRKATEPDLPLLSESGLDLRPGDDEAVTVVLRPEVHRLMTKDLELSFRMEEGGFLAGTVYQLRRGESRWVVLIDQVMPAKHTGASSVHFTFTGDSFQEMNRELSGGPSRLVGWYHTHLFSGEHSLEHLSSVDVDLHHSTFRQPWQVAGLINLTRDKRRLRFYTATADDMETCSLWVADERDGHSAERLDLGR